MGEDRDLSAAEAARHLGISMRALRRAVRTGDVASLPRKPKGRYRFAASAIAAFADHVSSPGAPSTVLAAAVHKLHATYAALACGVLVWAVTDEPIEANAAAQRILGATLEEMRRGKDPLWRPYTFIRLDGTPLPDDERPSARALRTGQAQHDVLVGILRTDGQRRTLRVDAVPIPAEDGSVAQVVVSFIDVTAQVEAEQALRAQEEDARLLFAASPQPMWVYDRHTLRFLEVNDAAIARYGYTRAEFLRMRLADIRPPEDRRRILEDTAQGRPTLRYSGEWRHVRKDGRLIEVEITSHTLLFRGHDAVLVVAHDITQRKQAEELLRGHLAFTTSITMTLGEGIYAVDHEGCLAFMNPAAERLLGWTARELRGQPMHAAIHFQRADGTPYPYEEHPVADVLRSRITVRIEDDVFTRKDGTMIPVAYTASPIIADGCLTGAVLAFRDMTEAREAEAALRASEARFRALSEHATDIVSILDADGVYTYVSPSRERILGFRPEEILGSARLDLAHPDDLPRGLAAFRALVQRPGAIDRMVLRQRHADGSWRTMEVIANNRLDDPAIQGVIVNSRDITERQQAEEALRYQALHDALTDLPNRALLQDRIQQALSHAADDARSAALLLLDLDRFKEVNDTFGHHLGDLLLQQVAARLRTLVRVTDMVARLGGDEFAVLLPGTDEGGAASVARAITRALDEPFSVEGYSFQIGASIGVALYPAHGQDAETLLRRADVAMYVAKRGEGGHRVYSAEHDHYTPDRLALLAELRQAIAHGELLLHFQPKIDLRTNGVCGVEALVRWPHPQHGLIRPDQFIPLAEQTGLIVPLTEWVLDAALAQARQWQHAGVWLDVAVNLSTHMLQDAQVVAVITALLGKYALPAERLILEITESALMADPARAGEVLTRLTERGIRVAIDDFGTGYSSLGYLKRLPVHEIKIDRSFVIGLGAQSDVTDVTDVTLVRTIIAMAGALGLSVVAEGVEDERTWHLLEALGCDIVQGFYVSRPLPAAELEHWLAVSPWCRPAPMADAG